MGGCPQGVPRDHPHSEDRHHRQEEEEGDLRAAAGAAGEGHLEAVEELYLRRHHGRALQLLLSSEPKQSVYTNAAIITIACIIKSALFIITQYIYYNLLIILSI